MSARRPTTSPTPSPKHSAHHPVVVSKHESCADGISKGADLLLPKHELQEVGFPWKFPEISGDFRRSAVGGRRSSPVGGRLTSAGGQISLEIIQIPVFFRGVKFPKEFLEICAKANSVCILFAADDSKVRTKLSKKNSAGARRGCTPCPPLYVVMCVSP